MTGATRTSLQIVTFGDLEAGVWGAAVNGSVRFIALGTPAASHSALEAATIDRLGEDEDWQLAADGVELLIVPRGQAVPATRPGGGASAGVKASVSGFDQLCNVSGTFVRDGAEHRVDCIGRRANRGDGLDLRRFESIRDVSAWFAPDDGLGLLALRPRGKAGHEDDLLTAAVFETGGSTPVGDPRLSTTYKADGRPARVSLELWLGEDEQSYPRRAAGEAVGPRARSASSDLDVQAELFRWHSRGIEGAGVYLLARSR